MSGRGAGGVAPYPRMIRRQAAARPGAVALHFEDRSLTFAELLARSARLASRLDAPPGTRVAVVSEKGPDWVTACLACSLAGAPFTIVDPRLTDPQREHVLDTWRPSCILYDAAATLQQFVSHRQRAGTRALQIEDEAGSGETAEYVFPEVTEEMPAFVDWTTGSTGKPKGVVMTHGHLCNMLRWRNENYPMADGEVTGVNMFPCWYWWMAMSMGCPTAVIPDSVVIDSTLFVAYLAMYPVARIDCITPSLLRAIVQDDLIHTVRGTLKIVVTSGEPLPLDTVALVHETLPATTVINLLSTTEAGDVAAFEVTPPVAALLSAAGHLHAPAGLPVTGVALQLIPYAADGTEPGEELLELCVSGSGVPQGAAYIGADAGSMGSFADRDGVRTWYTKDRAEKVRISMDEAACRSLKAAAYRDVAPGSSLEVYCLRGRLNKTAKVRGFRIDTAEVQQRLKELSPACLNSPVLDAHALAWNDSLVAFIRKPASEPAGVPVGFASKIRQELDAMHLPWSHQPSTYYFLKAFPQTPTGKVNAAVLQQWAEAQAVPAEYLSDSTPPAPSTHRPPQEALGSAGAYERVKAAWIQLLGPGVAAVDGDTSLFDVGGHSLTLTRLSQLLRLRVADLVENETMSQQAELLLKAGRRGDPKKTETARLPPSDSRFPVAIVGIAVRWPVPEGDNIDAVWASLLKPVDCSVPLADAVLEANGVRSSLLANPAYVKRGVLMDDAFIKNFDFRTFNLTKEEASLTDPNQRVLLELCYESLLDSGYAYSIDTDPAKWAKEDAASRRQRLGRRAVPTRNVGVFTAGPSLPQYLQDVVKLDTAACRIDDPARYWAVEVGNDKDYCSTRVSYLLNLQGPSQTVQSACSSGLLAVATAVQNLRAGTCEVAIAAAASIQLPQDTGYLHQPGMVWSVDGRCRPYCQEGTGTVPGCAAVSFVLKPLDRAEADGDRVYAVIKGCGVANDGRRKHTYNSPSRSGQVAAMTAALHDASVAAESVSMIEGHGTGTAIGDPIELNGLSEVYGVSPTISLGSVKGHIGHANTAAGAAGLLKAVLCLHHKTLVPTANHASPMLAVEHPLRVQVKPEPWALSHGRRKRVCGVSSFGVGGTNVHVVCEEYTPPPPAPTTAPQDAAEPAAACGVLLVSNRSRSAAEEDVERLRKRCAGRDAAGGGFLRAAAAALAVARPAYAFRSFLTFSAAAVEPAATVVEARRTPPKVVFLFPGQGGASENLSNGLRSAPSLPAYAAAHARCEAALGGVVPLNPASNEGSQVALFCLEYCLACVLTDQFHLRPAASVGHSLGEIVAAVVSGGLALDKALRFVSARGRSIDNLPTENLGRMASVAASEAEVRDVLSDPASPFPSDLQLACVNAPDRCVVAGSHESVLQLAESDVGKGWGLRLMNTAGAFHTSFVDPALPEVRAVLEGARLETGTGGKNGEKVWPVVSSVTGNWLSERDMASPAYWAAHMREPVLFSKAVELLKDELGEAMVVVECGPQLLKSCVASAARGAPIVSLMSRPSAAAWQSEEKTFWASLATIWQHGVNIDVNSGLPPAPAPPPSLPPPSWSREPCWPDAPSPVKPNSGNPGSLLQTTQAHVHLNAALPLKKQDATVELFEYVYQPTSTPPCQPEPASRTVWPVWVIDGELAPGALPLIECAASQVEWCLRVHGRLALAAFGADFDESPEDAMERLLRVVAVVQVLGAVDTRSLPARPHLVVVVPEGPSHAAVTGFFRAVARELPQLKLHRVVLRGGALTPDFLHAGVLTRVEAHALAREEEIAVTPGRCGVGPDFAVARLVKTGDVDRTGSLPKAAAGAPHCRKGCFAEKAVVVTGGTQGIGKELVSWSLDRGAKRVFVLSRTPPPPEPPRPHPGAPRPPCDCVSASKPAAPRSGSGDAPAGDQGVQNNSFQSVGPDDAHAPKQVSGRSKGAPRVKVDGDAAKGSKPKKEVGALRGSKPKNDEADGASPSEAEPGRSCPQCCGRAEEPRVVHVPCDVSRGDAVAEAMRFIFDTVDDLQIPLETIFHCAGVVSDSTIARLAPDVASLTRLMGAKVHGVHHLLSEVRKRDKLLYETPAVFLMSSSSAVLGPAGQAVYTAANAYLDSLCDQYRKTSDIKVISVQWGGWTVGMSERFKITPLKGETFLAPPEGLAAVEQLLQTGFGQKGRRGSGGGCRLLSADEGRGPKPEEKDELDTVVKAVPERRKPQCGSAVMVNRIQSWSDYSVALDLPTSLTEHLVMDETVSLLGTQLITSQDLSNCHSWLTIWPCAMDSNGSLSSQWAALGLSWLQGHVVSNNIVIPATFWLDLMTSAIRSISNTAQVTLESVRFKSAVEIPFATRRQPMQAGQKREVQTTVDTAGDTWSVRVSSRIVTVDENFSVAKATDWKVHCDAAVKAQGVAFVRQLAVKKGAETARRAAAGSLYESMAGEGFQYAGAFRCVEQVQKGRDGVVSGEVVVFPGLPPSRAVNAGAAAIDGCTQVAALLGCDGYPSRIERYTVFDEQHTIATPAANGPVRRLSVCAVAGRGGVGVDLSVSAENGAVLAAFNSFETTRVPSKAAAFRGPVEDVQWRPAAADAGRAARRGTHHVLVLAAPDEKQSEQLLISALQRPRPGGSSPVVHTAAGTIPPGELVEDIIILAGAAVRPPTCRVTAQTVVWAIGGEPPAALACFPQTVRVAVADAAEPLTWVNLSKAVTCPKQPAEGHVFFAEHASVCRVAADALLVPEFALNEAWKAPPEEEAPDARGSDAFRIDISRFGAGFDSRVVAVEEDAEDLSVGEDDVLIRAEVWALNFLDVLLASGVMASSETLGKVGGECAGVVLRVGGSVRSVKAGDRVAALPGKSGLGNRCVCESHRCVRIPDGMGLDEASTVSLAYGTAWLAVRKLARIQQGETVLIHAAAGGVGQACVRLCRRVGAVPLCTVSTEAKRLFLTESCGVDPAFVFNSRSATDFTAGVLAATGGQGVDAVINSLADESMQASLRLLKPFGRFVELGKRDQLSHASIDLQRFSLAQQYMSAHLDVLLSDRAHAPGFLAELWAEAGAGRLDPLPIKLYPCDQAGEAMTLLNTGKHIGKVLIDCRSAPLPARGAEPAAAAPPCVGCVYSCDGGRGGEEGGGRWCADFAAGAVSGGAAAERTETAAAVLRSEAPGLLRVVHIATPETAALLARWAGGGAGLVVVLTGEALRDRAVLDAYLAATWARPWVSLLVWNDADRSAVQLLAGAVVREYVPPQGGGGEHRILCVGRPVRAAAEGEAAPESAGLTASGVLALLKRHVADRLKVPPNDVDAKLTLSQLGFDSLAQLQLAHALRSDLSVTFVSLQDDASLLELAQALASGAPLRDEGAGPGEVLRVPDGTAPADVKKRVLCLHGWRDSRALLLAQLKPLLGRFARDGVQLVLVNAPHKATGTGHPDIPADEELFEWWHCPLKRRDAVLHYEDAWDGDVCVGREESVEYVRALAEQHGPFDGVIGFSQGAAMALLAISQQLASWGILLSSVLCKDPGYSAILDASDFSRVPTLHMFDVSEPYSQSAADLFTAPVVVLHENGHTISWSPDVIAQVASFVSQQT
ncbi:PKTS1 [Diplonema papillatum]|nr:PKTS1 [Diplonema papillatum]